MNLKKRLLKKFFKKELNEIYETYNLEYKNSIIDLYPQKRETNLIPQAVEGVIYNNQNPIPYKFCDGKITLLCGGLLSTIEEGSPIFIGYDYNFISKQKLFHLAVPYSNFASLRINGSESTSKVAIGNITLDVDYYIDNYEDNSMYNKMEFSFTELEYFIPSSKVIAQVSEKNQYSIQEKELDNFNFILDEKTINFKFKIWPDIHYSQNCDIKTKTSLILEFDETNDFEFLLKLYNSIRNLFTFIFNRKNVDITDATLYGKRTISIPSRKKTVDAINEEKIFHSKQKLVIVDNYLEKRESESTICNQTIRYNMLRSHFSELFQLILNDTISVQSIHSSNNAKNLIDLKQSLHITAAFEYYQRTLLPEISSEETKALYDEIKKVILEYSNSLTGKKKRKAADIANMICPTISLQSKIVKVYKGYGQWKGLQSILDEWFGGDLQNLSNVANGWRNELAHEKRQFEPTYDVVKAVRLIEHINYCIILRIAGFSDTEIKKFVEEVLKK